MSIKPSITKDEEMIAKVIVEAQAAIDSGGAGVAALLRWQDKILVSDRNLCIETGDLTAHAEMVVIRAAAKQLAQMSEQEKADLTLYTTLEPCLMCLSAISFVGIKRVVYSALAEDANSEEMIARGITADKVNPLLNRGQIELIAGVKREEGKELLRQMGKLR